MDNKIKISDFVKLTRSTLKTVLYYHKIGLLQEPSRSANGYRLYGAEELSKMRMITHLKHLGLDLKQIRNILGDAQSQKTFAEVLQALHTQLLREKNNIEKQLYSIETILSEETPLLEDSAFGSDAFKKITEILEPEQTENYLQTCPELYNQQRTIFSIMDDFHWGENYQENFNALAEYFKSHPEQYIIALEFGKRLAALEQMSEDNPEVELLAKESSEFIKSIPALKDLLFDKSGFGLTYENLFNELSKNVRSPAQMKHKQLIQKYLNYRP